MVGNKRGSVFLNIISIIGAILILVGVAWLIADNWSSIPDFMKTMVLIFSTLLALGAGLLVRGKDHEYIARALFLLGGGLYVLTVFLISQIYHIATTQQDYTWLLLLMWVVVIILAYILKSPENLLGGLVLFFPWLFTQYGLSVQNYSGAEGVIILMFVFLILAMGILLYGLSIFHNALKHPFASIYRFWTVFYFLALFYILSFQNAQPLIGNYELGIEAISLFFMFFVLIAGAVFIFSVLFASSRNTISIKEISIFILVVFVLLSLVLMMKMTAGSVGTCFPANCYDFDETSGECNSAPSNLNCEWQINEGMNQGVCRVISCYGLAQGDCESRANSIGCKWNDFGDGQGNCNQIDCYGLETSGECNSAPDRLNCAWENERCIYDRQTQNSLYETCRNYNNEKDSCLDKEECNWRSGSFIQGQGELMPFGVWALWLFINGLFIGFIILILGYGQLIGSTKIINLGLFAFILEIISRYIGFWMDLSGYFAFSILAILGGIMLIVGAWIIPKWRKNLLDDASSQKNHSGKI